MKKRISGDGFGYINRQRGEKIIGAHVYSAIKALGKDLPKGAEVHHVDLDKSNNKNSNLVICPNRQYHALIHVRTSALLECGNANFRKCVYCKKYDDPINLFIESKSGGRAWHRPCVASYVSNHRKINGRKPWKKQKAPSVD